jgi:hypothetical protein
MHQQQSPRPPRPPQLCQMHQQQSPTTSSQRPVDSLQMKQPWTLVSKHQQPASLTYPSLHRN